MSTYWALTKSRQKFEAVTLTEAACDTTKKGNFYSGLINEHVDRWEDSQWYEYSYKRYYKTIGRNSQLANFFTINCVSPLIIGNGGQSVLETHLTIHRVYGVPYLPGTALKGIAAHYCHKYLGGQDARFCKGGDYHCVLFGTQDEAGLIRFYDAWPTVQSVSTALRLDVLTPHHSKYNMTTAHQPAMAPRDDDSPNPVPFLSVCAEFQIGLAWGGKPNEAEDWLAIAQKILIHALKQEGIGGKTNAGYGQMKVKEGPMP